MPTSVEARNMELMQTLDDAWNEQNVEVFRARHKPDVIVRWPGQPNPTIGIEDHTAESIAFWKTFPDQRLDNRPYRVFFAAGDWTCSIARFRGTMTGPMMMGPARIACEEWENIGVALNRGTSTTRLPEVSGRTVGRNDSRQCGP